MATQTKDLGVHTEQTESAARNGDIHLLATPLEIASYGQREELLDALQNLVFATMSENEHKIRIARMAARSLLMRERPATYQAALTDLLAVSQ